MDGGASVLMMLAAYLIGTFPTAHLVGRRMGFDPMAAGSGNPGASNTTRLGGAKAGAMVLLGDAGKGVVAAGLISSWVRPMPSPPESASPRASSMAVLGPILDSSSASVLYSMILAPAMRTAAS